MTRMQRGPAAWLHIRQGMNSLQVSAAMFLLAIGLLLDLRVIVDQATELAVCAGERSRRLYGESLNKGSR